MRHLRKWMVWSFVLGLALAPLRGEDLTEKSRQAKELMAAERYAEAVPKYRELVKALPKNPGPLLNLGLALHMSGQEEEAVRRFQAVLKLDPHLMPAHLFLGAAYLGLKEPAKAIRPLQVVVRAQPDDKDARLMLGEALLALSRFEAAAGHFEKLTELDPENPKTWNGLGLSYEGLAAHEFAGLEETALGSPYWLALVAEARAKEGLFTRAFLLYRDAEAKMPNLRGIHTAIADIYRRTNHPEWAAVEEEKERRLAPLDCSDSGGNSGAAIPASARAASPAGNHDAEKALQCGFSAGRYREVLEKTRGDQTQAARFWRTRAYNRLALQAFSKLAELPPSAQVFELMGRINFVQRNYPESLKAWRQALKYSPQNPYYRQGLATTLTAMRDYDGAKPILEELVHKFPDSSVLNYWLGNTYLGLLEPQQAIPLLEKAVQADPTMLAAHRDLARAYLQVGQTEQAIPHLKAALPIDEEGSLYYQLSRAYRDLGQQKLAAEMLEKFRQTNKSQGLDVDPDGQLLRITPP